VCPDGNPAGSAGCGDVKPENSRWASATSIDNATPKGWYLGPTPNLPTYDPNFVSFPGADAAKCTMEEDW
jgi:hypothetical protein